MAEITEQKIVNGVYVEKLQSAAREFKDNPGLARFQFRAHNRWINGGHNHTSINRFYGAGQEQGRQSSFELDADEPPVLAGTDRGPNPVEHLLNSLAACLTTAMVYHAAIRGIHLEEVESNLEGDLDIRGLFGLEKDVRPGYQNINVTFRVKSDADPEKLKALSKFSPTFDVVTHGTNVNIKVERK